MKYRLLFVFIPAFLTGCVTNAELPANGQPITVIEYADALIQATTASALDKMIDTMERTENASFRAMKGAWCPRHAVVDNQNAVRNQFKGECMARGGHYDGVQLCHMPGRVEEVLFVAKVGSTAACSSGGRNVHVEIVEPTADRYDPTYVSALRPFGYETSAERGRRLRAEKQRAEAYREQQEAEFKAREARRLKQNEERREAIMAAGIGTRICRTGEIDYILQPNSWLSDAKRKPGILMAQLDGKSEDASRLRFRILEFMIPTLEEHEVQFSHSFRMDQFRLEPGAVYWDLVTSWTVCDY
jgi:hypothetical protein